MQNLYTQKTATKEALCFICSKLTSAVLTNDAGDFFFVCVSHIKDPTFCKPSVPVTPAPAQTPAPPTPQTKDAPPADNQSSIGGFFGNLLNFGKQEEPKKEDEKANNEKEVAKATGDGGSSVASTVAAAASTISATASAALNTLLPTKPLQYILDNRIYFLREDFVRKKQNKKTVATELLKFPEVPKTRMPG